MTRPAGYLLRVRLPDQPGVLGRVATALGNVGADIEAVAVVDRAGEYAVDDFVVALPAGALADRLVSAVNGVSGAIVESVQRHHGRRRMQDDLTLLDAASTSDHPLATLVDGLPELMQVSYAVVASREEPGAIVVLAASAGAPDAPMQAWLPVVEPTVLAAGDVWQDETAAGPDCDLLGVPFRPDAGLLLGRMGGPPFLAAEITRAGHLARVARALFAEGAG